MQKRNKTNALQKFLLLLWKNWVLQKRHKVKTAFELLIPILLSILMVVLRISTEIQNYTEPAYYPPFSCDDIPSNLSIISESKAAQKTEVKSLHSELNSVASTIADMDDEQLKDEFDKWKTIIRDLMSANLTQNFSREHSNVNISGDSRGFGFNWPVAFTPVTAQTRAIMEVLSSKLMIVTQGLEFETEDEMVKFLLDDYGKDLGNYSDVLGGIVFNIKDDGEIKIKIRLSAIPRSSGTSHQPVKSWMTKYMFPLNQISGPRQKELIGGGFPGYYGDGFLALQHSLSIGVLQVISGVDKKVDVDMNRFPYPPYTFDPVALAMKMFLATILSVSFIYPAIDFCKSLVYEKERRLKESMKMMGLSNWMHWSAWFTKCLILMLLPIILVPLFLTVRLGGSDTPAVLDNSQYFVILLFILLFVICVISYAFMVSVFFSKANSAGVAAGILWFVSYCPYYYIQPRYQDMSKAVKMVLSLFHMTALALGSNIIGEREITGEGSKFGNLCEPFSIDDNLSLADVMLMLVADTGLYLLITWYVEAVFPGEFGVPQPWYFPVTKRYWLPWSVSEETATSEDISVSRPDLFEKEPALKYGIQIKGLSKRYKRGKALAVDNMTLNMCRGQITALLGHNGAGKSTTMSILTGLFPATSGTALVNGHNIKTDINLVRSSLGLCPQHNVLFDEMTVEEHLYFFCKLKGVDPEEVSEETDRYIQALELDDKKYNEARTLSGGMKRKLSVIIALCGGSKVVMLDEPTAGMDPQARRTTWDLLIDERQDRTILLTTHFMEEADLLGDRIAIMAAGKVQCCGSSLFLKKKFGAGYYLVMVKEPICDVSKAMSLLQKHVPSAEQHQNIGAELSVILPDDQSSKFPELFTELEDEKEAIGISSYGLSITTMEEVFIRVGEMADDKLRMQLAEASTRNQGGAITKDPESLEQINIAASNNASTENLVLTSPEQAKAKWGQQLWSQVYKKFLYARRSKKETIAQLLAPLLYVVMTVIIAKNEPGIKASPSLTLTLDSYDYTTTVYNNNSNTAAVIGIAEEYEKIVKMMDGNNKIMKVDEPITNFSNYLWESAVNDDVISFNRHNLVAAEFSEDPQSVRATVWFNNEGFHTAAQGLSMVDSAIINYYSNKDVPLKIVNHPLPLSESQKIEKSSGGNNIGFLIAFNIAFGMSFLAASFCVVIIRERSTRAKHLQLVAGLSYWMYWIGSIIFDYTMHLICCISLIIALAAFQEEGLSEADQLGRFFLLFIFYGFSMLPLTYLLSYLFTIPSTGFAVLTLFNIVTGMITILTVTILRIPELELTDVANILDWVFLFFPNYSMGMGIQELWANHNFNTICDKLTENDKFISCVFEDKACCEEFGGECGMQGCAMKNYFSMKRSGAGRMLLCMAASSVLYGGLLALIELRIPQKIKYLINSRRYSHRITDIEKKGIDEDDDVADEKQRIRDTPLEKLKQENNLIISNLTKYYGNFLAVNDLCLGVGEEECFGLLGVNGAGKTSTFKMLTGDETITSGDAYVDGFSCSSQISKVQKKLGYCPQFDAVIDLLTGYENIQLFCRLHGVAENAIPDIANSLAKSFFFEEHLHKLSEKYSGGNKRKLSTSLALVGDPPIIFLDEPTTGMDPVARRLLWDTISRIRSSGKSIVLTSHSMEECEALCTRLAIMVNGKFYCLGSIQHLKSKFGKGYTLIAKIASRRQTTIENGIVRPSFRTSTRTSISESTRGSISEQGRGSISMNETWGSIPEGRPLSAIGSMSDTQRVKRFIETTFPGAVLKDSHQGMVHYEITEPELSWAKIFRAMEDNKEEYNIRDYSVGQTTLEQVFLRFAKQQNEESVC